MLIIKSPSNVEENAESSSNDASSAVQLERENTSSSERAEGAFRASTRLGGEQRAMKDVREMIERIASTNKHSAHLG